MIVCKCIQFQVVSKRQCSYPGNGFPNACNRLLWHRRHILQNRATGGSRPRREATALWRPPSPYLRPLHRSPFEYRVLRRYQCWFAGTTNGRGNVPLTDRRRGNGQEVALPENRHPILQGVGPGTSLHRARIRTSGASYSSVRCGDSAFGIMTAAALTQWLMRASSFRRRLRGASAHAAARA